MRIFGSIALAGAMAVLAAPVARAADLGLGMLAYDQGQYAAALAEWVPLAEDGNAMAQALLGLMYRTGEGVVRDPAVAADWYGRAARQGHPYAQFNLAEMLRDGEGVAADPVRAYVWFSLAAEGIPVGEDGTNAASRARDVLGATMSEDAIAEARALAPPLVDGQQ